MAHPPFGAAKAVWRDWARQERSRVAFGTVGDAIVDHLATWEVLGRAVTVLVFLPLPDEIDLLELVQRNLACRFVATHTPERGGVLSMHELGGPLEVHRMGFLQPQLSAPRVDPGELDVVLLPGLAFGRDGNRLGRGAGYFDEFLSRVPDSVLRVGVVPDALVVDDLPSEAHDEPVHMLATERGLQPVGDGAAMDAVVRRMVYQHFVDHAAAPSFEVIAGAVRSRDAAAASLRRLHDQHALVIDGDHEVTMALPFSAGPTDFVVKAGDRSWFANCAWDAMAIIAAVGVDAEVVSHWSDTGEPLRLVVDEGRLQPEEGFVGFTVPARQWWDDIAFT